MTRYLRGILVFGLLVFAVEGLNAFGPAAQVVDAADQATAAVQQVIQQSNNEQVQAIASRDSSVMADSVTADHYQELAQINQDLLDNGVNSISLVGLDWGAVAVNGSSATATTYETWRTVFSDGTIDQSRDRNDYTLVLDGGAWKISGDAHPDQVSPSPRPAPGTPPQTQPFPFPDDQNTSHNWSGYAATGGTYTQVSGTWTVPQFNADNPGGIDAAWVGIGGVRSRDLIQAGTQQTVSGGGRTQYEAWIEVLPRASRPVPLQVHGGDSVTVDIAEQSSDQWLIEFTNNTTGQTYNTIQPYTSSHSSAEWVEEAPSGGRGGGVLPLDNFGSVPFSNGSTTRNGQSMSIQAAGARAITMIGNGNQQLAVPSALGADGASFTVSRTDAPVNTAGPGRRGLPGRGFPFPIVPLPGGGD
jgi:hypothetical protein